MEAQLNEKHPGGRPRLYDDPEKFAAKVDDYFEVTKFAPDEKPTLLGVSLYLGFSDRDSFVRYAEYGEEFSRTIKKAKAQIEQNRIQLLLSKDKFTPGVIFDLKNNHGWKDKQEVEISGDLNVMTRIDRARRRSED